MNITLTRACYTPLGTVGTITIEDADFACYSIERPWLANIPSESCIPVGEYTAKLGTFYRNTPDPGDDYPAWEVLDVPGRTLIKVHRGNTMLDVKGCIAVGNGLELLNGLWFVKNSRTAYSRWMEATSDSSLAALKIVNAHVPGSLGGR